MLNLVPALLNIASVLFLIMLLSGLVLLFKQTREEDGSSRRGQLQQSPGSFEAIYFGRTSVPQEPHQDYLSRRV
jgi:hypothetical protein